MSSAEFLIWLERFRSPFTNATFIGASGLGSTEAYMVLLTGIYLCVGHRFGFRLMLMFLLSAYSNALLKIAFHTKRPFHIEGHPFHPLSEASAAGYSFPSGHAQNAAVVWSLIAIRQKSWRVRAPILLLIALIGLSRLYCEVHWPVDVVGGLLIGAVLVVVYLTMLGWWHSRGKRLSGGQWAVVVVGVAGLMYLVGYRDEVCRQSVGALLGSGLGYLLLDARGFKAAAPLMTQVLKVAIALLVLLALQRGGESLLGDAHWAAALTYALIGFTAAYLLPVFFSQFPVWRQCISSRQFWGHHT